MDGIAAARGAKLRLPSSPRENPGSRRPHHWWSALFGAPKVSSGGVADPASASAAATPEIRAPQPCAPEACNRRLRILSVGPLPPPLGGTTVSFKQLKEFLEKRDDVSVETINSFGVRGSGLRGMVMLLKMLASIYRAARRTDVIALHCSTTALHSFALMVFVLSRLCRKPLLIRRYGGASHTELPPLKRKLAQYVVSHADLNLLESKKQVEIVRNVATDRVVWYPTSRPYTVPEGEEAAKSTPCRRFVYLGQVIHAKGIREIIAADPQLGALSIDVYGPMRYGAKESDFEGCKRVRYRGTLAPDQVFSTLSEYDVLLLPTYYEGEGYPGVIVEAYASGLPVICTRWKDIPELVDESCGIFVEARNVEALLAAMRRLAEDHAEFTRLREGALAKRVFFSLSHWGEEYVGYCRRLAGKA